jgi:hypothetical protein
MHATQIRIINMNTPISGAAFAAWLLVSAPAVAQVAARPAQGHFEITPGPRGTTRWLAGADGRHQPSRPAKSADARPDMLAECMAMPCCGPMMRAGQPSKS